MKFFTFLFCVGICVGFSGFSSAWAVGGSTIGNGGGAVICRDASKRIQTAELLDLYEGHALYGFGYREQATPPETQARAFVPALDELLNLPPQNSLLPPLDSIINRIHFLPPGVGLSSTEDFGSFIIPKSCEIAQAINFRNDWEIFADSDIWKQFSKTHRAAAFVHELIYEYARENGDEINSMRVRRLVSYLLAGRSPQPVLPAALVRAARVEKCETVSSTFYTLPNPDGSGALFFTRLNGRVALSQSVAQIPAPLLWPVSENHAKLFFRGPLVSEIERGVAVQIETLGEDRFLSVREPLKQTREMIKCSLTRNTF